MRLIRRATLFLALTYLLAALTTAHSTQQQQQQQQGQQQAGGQTGRQGAPPPPPTLGLEDGLLEFDTPDFTVKLVKASQTIAALEPKGVPTYTPTPTPRVAVAGRGDRRIADSAAYRSP